MTFPLLSRVRPRSSLERGGTRSRPDTGNVGAIEETDENAPEPEAVKVEPPPPPPPQPDVLTLEESVKEVSLLDFLMIKFLILSIH